MIKKFILVILLVCISFSVAFANNAVYSSIFTAPLCDFNTSQCIANSSLLSSRNDLATPEPNFPNTIDICTDGTLGTYLLDESVENVTITTLNGTQFDGGDTIRVDAWVHCYSTADNINIVYTPFAEYGSPPWEVKAYTASCPGSGFHNISHTFELDDYVGYHAVRTIIQYNGNTDVTCGTGGYDDNDDVVFYVNSENTPPPEDKIREDGNRFFVNTLKYRLEVSQGTQWSSIINYYSKDYNSNEDISAGYLASYLQLLRSPPGMWNGVWDAGFGLTDASIEENGFIRGILNFETDANMNITYYFYDEYYVGRVTTSGFTDDNNDGLRVWMVVDDNNSTGGYDRGGLNYIEGPLGSVDSTTSTSTQTHSDLYNLNTTNHQWINWYGATENDLKFGMVTQKMHPDSTTQTSIVYDIETTGSDYIRNSWTRTNALNNYDALFKVGMLSAGNSSDEIKHIHSLLENPATVTCVSANCDSTNFEDKGFYYEIVSTNSSENLYFNVTGNTNWFEDTGKLYFELDNGDNQSRLHRKENGNWDVITTIDEIQNNDNNTFVFYVEQNKTEETEYMYGILEDENVIVESIDTSFSGNPSDIITISSNVSHTTSSDNIENVILNCNSDTNNTGWDYFINNTPIITNINSTWNNYEFTIETSVHSEPGNWICEVTAECEITGRVDFMSDNFNMNERIGIILNVSLLEDSFDPGVADNLLDLIEIKHDGNIDYDLSVVGTDLTGTIDISWIIPVGNLKYDESSLPGTSLTNSSVIIETPFTRGTYPNSNTLEYYWWITMPSPLKSQLYSGTITYEVSSI